VLVDTRLLVSISVGTEVCAGFSMKEWGYVRFVS